jgi:hypothetical protein
MRTASAFRAAEHEYLFNGGGYSRKVAQCQTYQRRGGMIRGIAAEERFVYEIMQLCLVITLTNLDDLLKIRGIQKQKEKRLTRSLPFTKAPELPTAYPLLIG